MVSNSPANNSAMHPVVGKTPSTGLFARVAELVNAVFNPFPRSKPVDPLFEKWGQYKGSMIPEDQRLVPPMENYSNHKTVEQDAAEPAIQNSLVGVLDYASHKLFRDYAKNPVISQGDVIYWARVLASMEKSDEGLAVNV